MAFMRVRLQLWHGLVAIGVSLAVISWATFMRNSFLNKFGLEISESWKWAECNVDGVIIGPTGTVALLIVALIFGLINRKREVQA